MLGTRSQMAAGVVFALLVSCKKDPPPAADAGAIADAEVAPAAAEAGAPAADAADVADAAPEAATATAPTPTVTAVKPLPKPAAPNAEVEGMCARARVARTRNSPAAGALEAKCRALGGTP